jgi:hypothetical protein
MTGTREACVTVPSSISAEVRAGSKRGQVTRRHPTDAARWMSVSPPTWANDRDVSHPSRAPRCSRSITRLADASRFPWVRETGFGDPVLPEVRTTTAGSPRERRGRGPPLPPRSSPFAIHSAICPASSTWSLGRPAARTPASSSSCVQEGFRGRSTPPDLATAWTSTTASGDGGSRIATSSPDRRPM